jgi:uncharacterized protein (DUF924 family)
MTLSSNRHPLYLIFCACPFFANVLHTFAGHALERGDAVAKEGRRVGEEMPGPDEVLAFWRAAGRQKWFEKDAAFDREIASRFLKLWQAAVAGKLKRWEEKPETALALVIVLDQFPRNMFRGQARCFDSDLLARAVAQRAISDGFDQRVAREERGFFYLPFMHSENLADQERCLALARAHDDDEFSRHAGQHADIICRFGRFPHRNPILGRSMTPEEQAFLDAGGFAG